MKQIKINTQEVRHGDKTLDVVLKETGRIEDYFPDFAIGEIDLKEWTYNENYLNALLGGSEEPMYSLDINDYIEEHGGLEPLWIRENGFLQIIKCIDEKEFIVKRIVNDLGSFIFNKSDSEHIFANKNLFVPAVDSFEYPYIDDPTKDVTQDRETLYKMGPSLPKQNIPVLEGWFERHSEEEGDVLYLQFGLDYDKPIDTIILEDYLFDFKDWEAIKYSNIYNNDVDINIIPSGTNANNIYNLTIKSKKAFKNAKDLITFMKTCDTWYAVSNQSTYPIYVYQKLTECQLLPEVGKTCYNGTIFRAYLSGSSRFYNNVSELTDKITIYTTWLNQNLQIFDIWNDDDGYIYMKFGFNTGGSGSYKIGVYVTN